MSVGNIDERIKTYVSVPKDQIDSCIYCVHSEPDDKSKKINCDFYIIRCTSDDIREYDFLRILRNLIIKYALKKSEYDKLSPDNAVEIVKTAKGRFVNSEGSGEIGEIILFALLESQYEAPQILNKMTLKTNNNVHYHGLDGIHLGINGDKIVLYYGESKVKVNHTNGIRDAAESLGKFHKNPEKETFEINLISNYIDISKFGDYSKEIIELLNPYKTDKSNLKKMYAVFIGFNWQSLENFDLRNRDGMEDYLIKYFEKHYQKIYRLCDNNKILSDINHSIIFFFIPFKDVEEIKREFNRMIQ